MKNEITSAISRITKRRGFATMIVLWVVGIAVILMAAVESAAYRQAAAGREAVAQVRAHWAARAGVEVALARIEESTLNPDTQNAYALTDQLAAAADGVLGRAGAGQAAYRISYIDSGVEHLGAFDAHSRININTMTADDLILLPRMTEDIADAILDWIDSDDDPKPLGAEDSYYESSAYPYKPRNAPMRSLAELELIPGVTPQMVRGEDWNLNGRLDLNEDDGDASWPPDNADEKLDAGWSGIVTAASRDGGLSASGKARLDLATASPEEIVQRVRVTTDQADIISEYGATQGATMGGFIQRDLSRLVTPAAFTSASSQADALTRDQLATLFDEAQIGAASSSASGSSEISSGGGTRSSTDSSSVSSSNPSAPSVPGKLNINTCAAEALEYLPELDPALADAIIAARESNPNGFSSIADLLDVPGMTRGRVARISGFLDIRSNVYVVSSRGRDAATGIEVELVATIDRSTLPAMIRELRAP